MKLEFDVAAHRYRLNGRIVPSVTQVLARYEDWSMVPPAVLEAARIFGQQVHEACDLFDRDGLEWSSLDPEVVPYVEAWKKFLHESGAIVIASEQPLAHEQLGYAGTPDKVLSWDRSIVIPDLKATAVVPRTVGVQTAGYAKAYQSMHGGREPARRCIHLQSGQYRVHARKSPADWTLFLSALNWHKFLEQQHVATA